MKKNAALTIIATLAVLAVLFGILYVTNNSSKTKEIETLNASVAEKAGQIETLTADAAEKAGQIEALNADVTEKTGQIETLTANASRLTEKVKAKNVALDEKNRQVKSLMAGAKDKDEQIAALTAEAAEKDGRIGELTAESAAKDKTIETLNADAAEKAGQIETLTAEAAEKDKTIETLTADAAKKDSRIEELDARVKSQAEEIQALTAELERKKTENKEQDSKTAPGTEAKQNGYTFFGMEWGTPVSELMGKLPAGVELSYTECESFRSVPGYLYMGNETIYKGPIGFRAYGYSDALGGLEYEGYKVEALFVYAIRLVGEDGKLAKDDSQSAFIEAYCELKPTELAASYDELLAKTKALYGEPAEYHETKGICYVWLGEDGSLLALQKDGELIKVKCVAGGAGELIENAYQAYKNPGSVRPIEPKKTGTETPDYSGKYIGTWKFSKIEASGMTLDTDTMALLGYTVSGECIIGKESGSLNINMNGEIQKGDFKCEFSEAGLTTIDSNGIRESLVINEAGELVFKNNDSAMYFVKAE